ncbi:putative MFS-type transporter YfkL [Frankliniella fusca]|uniref:MFS-type transporter YfkL n=1 Tax=Frankliniella fusca TaxID=407009 RepID=A0AAE1LSJ0_9NEOP|nr:putative MFS-type transporter YfkL [Frankliniella fusca]
MRMTCVCHTCVMQTSHIPRIKEILWFFLAFSTILPKIFLWIDFLM